MISSTDRAQIYHPEKRAFLFIDHKEADVGREDRCYQWLAPATAGHRWGRDVAERFLDELVPDGSQWLQDQFIGCIVVQAPICACCGDRPFRELTCVRGNRDPAKRQYRCQKHKDRLPCIIEGCGRTFGMKDDDSYYHIVMCGRHWRQAPKYMRDAVARVRKLARRHGWSDQLLARHHRLWERCHRAIREGQNLDMAEIERMFGI